MVESVYTYSSHHEGPYLFDVGVIALAHTDAPVRDAALSYVRRAIAGETRGGRFPIPP